MMTHKASQDELRQPPPTHWPPPPSIAAVSTAFAALGVHAVAIGALATGHADSAIVLTGIGVGLQAASLALLLMPRTPASYNAPAAAATAQQTSIPAAPLSDQP